MRCDLFPRLLVLWRASLAWHLTLAARNPWQAAWVQQWVDQVDGRGRAVLRGIGVAKENPFSNSYYGHPGKAAGTCRGGVLDGMTPAPNPLAIQRTDRAA